MSSNSIKIEHHLIKYSGIALFLLLWELIPRSGLVSAKIVPPFSSVMTTAIQLWWTDSLYTDMMVSAWRVLTGILLAAAISIPLGFVLAVWFPFLAELLEPLFRIFGQVNPFSLSPIFVLFFGIGEEAKVAVILWICLWPILFHTINGVKLIDPSLIKAAASMNISPGALMYKVLLPGSSPGIFNGLRIGAQMSFFILMAGEMLGGNAGLGWLLHRWGHYYIAPKLYAISLYIVLLGVLLDKFLKFLQKGLFFWKENAAIRADQVEPAEALRLGKVELTCIVLIVTGILFLGAQQVDKAYEDAANPLSKLSDLKEK